MGIDEPDSSPISARDEIASVCDSSLISLSKHFSEFCTHSGGLVAHIGEEAWPCCMEGPIAAKVVIVVAKEKLWQPQLAKALHHTEVWVDRVLCPMPQEPRIGFEPVSHHTP